MPSYTTEEWLRLCIHYLKIEASTAGLCKRKHMAREFGIPEDTDLKFIDELAKIMGVEE